MQSESRWRRFLRSRWSLTAGIVLIVAGAITAAYFVAAYYWFVALAQSDVRYRLQLGYMVREGWVEIMVVAAVSLLLGVGGGTVLLVLRARHPRAG